MGLNGRQVFCLVHDRARANAEAAVRAAQDGYVVEIKPPTRTLEQNAKYHTIFTEISDRCEFMGRAWDVEDWKRLLVDAFAKVMRDAGTPLHEDARVVPSLDGERVVQLGTQTRRFYKSEAGQFIEFLHAFAAEHGVELSQ